MGKIKDTLKFTGHSLASMLPGTITFQFTKLGVASLKNDQLHEIKREEPSDKKEFVPATYSMGGTAVEAITYLTAYGVANQDDIYFSFAAVGTGLMIGARLFSYHMTRYLRKGLENKNSELEQTIKEDYQNFQKVKELYIDYDSMPLQ